MVSQLLHLKICSFINLELKIVLAIALSLPAVRTPTRYRLIGSVNIMDAKCLTCDHVLNLKTLPGCLTLSVILPAKSGTHLPRPP